MPDDRGLLGPLTLPLLVQELHGQGRTGTLALRDEGLQKTLYLDGGRVVFATSSDPDDRLGQLFLQRRMITLQSLKQAAVASTTSGQRMGGVLVQMKAIRAQDLVWGVSEQVKQMVIGLFQWTRGSYTFTPGSLPSEEVITLKMPTGDLIMDGIKSIDSWSRIEQAVGDLDTVYRGSPRLQDLARELTLSLEEWTLLSHCEAGGTLGEICAKSPLGDFEACRLIWAFMVVGLLRKGKAAASAGGVVEQAAV